MANIANFEVNGVSYAYDTESRNPLATRVRIKQAKEGIVYDINTKAPTEVVGIPANKLKAVEEEPAVEEPVVEEPVEPTPVEPTPAATKTKTVYFDQGSGDIFVVEVTYTGDINSDNVDSLRLNYEHNGETGSFGGGASLQSFSGSSETYPAITPDEGEETPNVVDFNVVSRPSYYEDYTFTSITYEED